MSSNFWTSSHCNHWIIPRPTLTLSRTLDLTYLSPPHLSLLHILFSTIISKLGRKLSLRHLPIHTADVYFKRFYLINGFCETDPWLVVATVVYVAAKVEETPVHVKTVVSEARSVFAEYIPKPSLLTIDHPRIAEMEFYLLEDLHFDLFVFHPSRALLAICNREPADGGERAASRADVWAGGSGTGSARVRDSERDEVPRKRKRRTRDEGESDTGEEEDGLDGMGKFGGAATGSKVRSDVVEEEEESQADKVDRLNGRGSGLDALEVEDSVVQMAWFILNDTYRTDLILLHPPYMIALAALYLAFSLSDTKPDAPNYRVKGKRWTPIEWAGLVGAPLQQGQSAHQPGRRPSASLLDRPLPVVQHGGKGLLTRFDAPEWFAGLRIAFEDVLEAVQEIVSIYTLWEELEGAVGTAGGGLGAGGSNAANIPPGLARSSTSFNGNGNAQPGGPVGGISVDPTFSMDYNAASATQGATRPNGSQSSLEQTKLLEKDIVSLLHRIQTDRSVDLNHPRGGGAVSR